MAKLTLGMMGTGEFALPTFECLYGTPHEVVGLFTQPDRVGSGHHRDVRHPMKELALARGTPLYQPQNVNAPEAVSDLRALAPDLVVVAAYGQILSPEVLSVARLGTINVHASLLPKYRGASPIVHAILNGDAETGVSIIQVLPRLDAGPILATVRTPIEPGDTAGTLEGRLARLAVEVVPTVIEQFARGELHPVPQAESQVTRAPKLKKAMGEIDWTQPAVQIERHVRAMQPWPNPFTFLHSPGKPPQRLLVLSARLSEPAAPQSLPGTPIVSDRLQLIVQTGAGALEILELQPDGKRRMTAADFLRGRSVTTDERFGPGPEVR